MKLLPIIAATLALTACAHRPTPVVPDPVQMPALPTALAQRAPNLPPMVATDLHGIIREGAQTDRAYNAVRDQLNAVIDVYGCVRIAINEQRDATSCMTTSLKQ